MTTADTAAAVASKAEAAAAAAPAAQSPAYTVETYNGDTQLNAVRGLMEVGLTEPYNVFTYRFFLDSWPELTLLAFSTTEVLDAPPQPEALAAWAKENRFYAPCKSGQWKRLIGGIVCQVGRKKKTGQLRGYIAMLAVDGEYRRHGIGRALACQAIRDMVQMGADYIALETDLENTTSIAFYERLGFIRERVMVNYYLFSGDAYKLILPLPKREEETGASEEELLAELDKEAPPKQQEQKQQRPKQQPEQTKQQQQNQQQQHSHTNGGGKNKKNKKKRK